MEINMYQDVKKQFIQLRKDRSPLVATASALIGEIDTYLKTPQGANTDQDQATLKFVRSFIKGIEDTHNLGRVTENSQAELAWLEQFLPKQMDQDATIKAVQDAIQAVDAVSKSDMGKVMGHLKQQYGAELDMKMASSIVREKLI